MIRRIAVIAAAIALLVWATASAGDTPVAPATSYATLTPSAKPSAMVAGYDGNEWFLETAAGPGGFQIGTVTPGGTVAESSGGSTLPTAIAPGLNGTSSAGAVWVATQSAGHSFLGAYGPLGTVQHPGVELPRGVTGVTGVAAGANGVIWVTESSRNEVFEVASPYVEADVTNFTGVPAGADPTSVAAGPGGTTMWFTDAGTHKIGEISAGTFTEFPLPTGLTGTLGNLVLGPDGNLWVGLSGTTSYVLRITPAGSITPFAAPASSTANVDALGVGPDGELWAAGGGSLESVSTSGTFTSYPGILPPADAFGAISADAGGADALWLTDTTASTIDRVALQPPTTPPPPPPPPSPTPPPPPALSTRPGPVSAVATTSVMLSGTIGETGASGSTVVTYHFDYGTSTAYGTSTTPASVTVSPSGATVTAPVSGLDPFTTYHYRLVASDCTTAACQAQSADQTFTTGTTLQPALDSTAGLAPVSGRITVKVPGTHRFRTLAAGATLPLGTVVNARHGVVLIVGASASSSGEVASGQFSSGVFEVTQHPPSTSIVLVLVSSYATCPAPVHGVLARAASNKKKQKKKKKKHYSAKVLNQVFGKAHGQFKTRGHYATAADEGTGWRTSDRCDGTLIAVTAGKVTLTDFVHHRTVLLTAGHHYLAQRP